MAKLIPCGLYSLQCDECGTKLPSRAAYCPTCGPMPDFETRVERVRNAKLAAFPRGTHAVAELPKAVLDAVLPRETSRKTARVRQPSRLQVARAHQLLCDVRQGLALPEVARRLGMSTSGAKYILRKIRRGEYPGIDGANLPRIIDGRARRWQREREERQS